MTNPKYPAPKKKIKAKMRVAFAILIDSNITRLQNNRSHERIEQK